MESLIEALDTHGVLSHDVFKIDIFKSAASTWLSDVENGNKNGAMNIKHNNIDYSAVPGLIPGDVTYKFFLTYNGTMSRNSATYSQVVLEEAGPFNAIDAPLFKYQPSSSTHVLHPINDNTVLNINFLTSEANILQWRGVPVGGNNTGFDVNRYSYPFTPTVLPNVSGGDTFFDGWYTSSFAVFKNAHTGDKVAKDQVFGHEGTVYTAPRDGYLHASGDILYVNEDGATISPTSKLVEKTTYKEFLLLTNRETGVETNTPYVSATTQILTTPELNNAIIETVLVGATSTECNEKCAIADWQKLQQKKIAANIQFQNGNYRKSQVIIESSRVVCNNRNLKNC